MGVSGAGKTTVGRLLADRLGWTFLDADDFHPPANIQKMASGQPLTDADREPWLEILRRRLDEILENRRGVEGMRGAVLACSALRRQYRRVLGVDRPGLELLYLDGPREIVAARLGERGDHFMPPALLDSQISTLEKPSPRSLRLDIRESPGEIVERVLDHFPIEEEG